MTKTPEEIAKEINFLEECLWDPEAYLITRAAEVIAYGASFRDVCDKACVYREPYTKKPWIKTVECPHMTVKWEESEDATPLLKSWIKSHLVLELEELLKERRNLLQQRFQQRCRQATPYKYGAPIELGGYLYGRGITREKENE